MDLKIKKLVATVALAGAVTAGTAGAAFAADGSTGGSTSGSSDPSAQTARRHPGLRREVRRGAFKIVLDTLGVSRDDLRNALKGGQSISEYAASIDPKDPQAVVDALTHAADAKLDQLVADQKLAPERAATIKGKVPDRVNTFVNRHFGQQAPAPAQT
jgi:hypothetical protein